MPEDSSLMPDNRNLLSVALLQLHIEWHNPETNLNRAEQMMGGVENKDVILLPEMWASGFTMKAHHYHSYTESALSAMQKWSKEKNALIIGSLIKKQADTYYNRLYAVSNGEVIAQYDKKHLFAYSGEDRFFDAGAERKLIDYKGWKLSLNICYDLRFPVWCRNVDDYDVSLFVANWPDKRISAWDSLLQARSIENQAYVLGCNCYGVDAWHNNYSGHSAIYGYDGAQLDYLENREGVIHYELDKQALTQFRNELPFLRDRDNFILQ